MPTPALRAGVALPALAGLPVSVKDLYDVAGEHHAGRLGRLPRRSRRAAADAPAVARLRAHGAAIVGKTNMTEFAFSGVGINPHHGTPRNPADAAVARIPGGSSSGAAVSVALGLAVAGLGSDTGGSIRIPAALCGLVGFKSTQSRTPRAGALELSRTLDTVCAMTRSVEDCLLVDAAIADAPLAVRRRPLAGLRLARAADADVRRHRAGGGGGLRARADDAVGRRRADRRHPAGRAGRDRAAQRAGRLLGRRGARGAPRSAWRTARERFDPRVRRAHRHAAPWPAPPTTSRCRTAAATGSPARPARSRASMRCCARRCRSWRRRSTPLVASDDAFFKANGLLLRNTFAINFLDGCAFSLPCHRAGELPVGLMLSSVQGDDARLAAVALAVEAALGLRRGGGHDDEFARHAIAAAVAPAAIASRYAAHALARTSSSKRDQASATGPPTKAASQASSASA